MHRPRPRLSAGADEQLTNAPAAGPVVPSIRSGRKTSLNCGERPRPYSVRLICHCGRTGTDRERRTPNIARRKQRTRPLRAHSNTWRPAGSRSLNRWSGSTQRSFHYARKKTITQSANAPTRRLLHDGPGLATTQSAWARHDQLTNGRTCRLRPGAGIPGGAHATIGWRPQRTLRGGA